jgi:uncharacterized protein
MDILLLILVFATAVGYATAGFGGASAYLAWFVLFGLPLEIVAPLALLCNLVVTAGGSYHFVRAGHFSLRLLLPFILVSIPAAYAGALWALDPNAMRMVLGFVLLGTAVIMFSDYQAERGVGAASISTAVLWGVGLPAGIFLGGLAGMVGIGGGVFLAALLYGLRWGSAKQIAACAAVFILLNSLSGLGGHAARIAEPAVFFPFLGIVAAVFFGGQIGSRLGAYRAPTRLLKQATAVLISIAAVRTLFTVFSQEEKLMGIGAQELLIVLAIVMLIFGATKLPALGAGLGKSIQNFKKAVRDGDAEDGEQASLDAPKQQVPHTSAAEKKAES